MAARVRIVGTELPGRSCGPAPTATGTYDDIHVGVQRARDVIGLVPGDAAQAVFEFEVDVKGGRFAGPFVHGRDGQRFIYLSWGEVIGDEFRMFRRAKLHIDHLDASRADGRVVEATLTLTDGKGHPLCASVRPPRVSWTIRGQR
jgi:hypothetical protein